MHLIGQRLQTCWIDSTNCNKVEININFKKLKKMANDPLTPEQVIEKFESKISEKIKALFLNQLLKFT